MAYTPNFRLPPLGIGNLIPGFTHSDSVRPHTDAAVAGWLPLYASADNKANGFFVRQEETTGDYIVITCGKLVAFTRENLGMTWDDGPVGRLVPAGVKLAWAAAAGGTDILEYDATDVAQRTQDLTTGNAVTAAVTYTKAQVTLALQERGLILDSESCEDFISEPVGLLAGSAYQWAGGDGLQPRGYRFHNYKRQHKNALLCDYVIRLPFVPLNTQVSRDLPAIATVIADIIETETPAVAGDAAWATGAGGHLAAEGMDTKYGTIAHTDYVAAVLGAPRIEVAPHLPLVITTAGGVDKTSTVITRRVKSPNDLTTVGDYYVDSDWGIVFFYEAGGNALPTGMIATDIIKFNQHGVQTTYLNDLAFISGLTVRPGDLLTFDKFSNLVKWSPTTAGTYAIPAEPTSAEVDTVVTDALRSGARILAQVMTMSRYPREDMERVKTFFDNLPTGILDKMPGSATGGYTDSQTYASGGQFEVIINFMK